MEKQEILNSSTDEIEEIQSALIEWYRQRFPNWEVIFLSLPKNDLQERRRILDRAYHFLNTEPKP